MVRTRFAPSPTGFLHIGSLRTALYSYALAKHFQGRFLLRIEDTDQKREIVGATDAIIKTLEKFGITADEQPVIQSQRAKQGVYIQAAEQLVAMGKAFFCQCQARNAKSQGFSQTLRDPCRDLRLTSGAIKLKVPDNRKITYRDFVLDKEIIWDSNIVADTTLLKSQSLERLPTYHLAVVIDDDFMQVSHALRGHDWLPSTPVHLLIYEFLGLKPPEIGHLTDIQSPQGGKLSKRRDSVFCETFISDGYLPEAILNFVMLLGWAPKDNRELFTLKEFVTAFDPKGFQKSNPQFLPAKLDWFNGYYLRHKSDSELVSLVKPYMKNVLADTELTRIVSLIKDRLVKITDVNPLTEYLFTPPKNTGKMFIGIPEAEKHLQHAASWIENHEYSKTGLETGWTDEIKNRDWRVGDYFMTLRLAVCGSRFTPPLTEVMMILGKKETISRLKNASEILKTAV